MKLSSSFSFLQYSIPLLLIVVLSIPAYCCAQTFTNQKPVNVYKEDKRAILQLLAKSHKKDGVCSNIRVQSVYLGKFVESADYGPMWYGDTIDVYKDGILISYDYDYVDNKSPKITIPYRSKDWHFSEKIFIAKDKSYAFRLYTCQFGGIPPSHGYANKRIKIDSLVEELLEVINIKSRK